MKKSLIILCILCMAVIMASTVAADNETVNLLSPEILTTPNSSDSTWTWNADGTLTAANSGLGDTALMSDVFIDAGRHVVIDLVAEIAPTSGQGGNPGAFGILLGELDYAAPFLQWSCQNVDTQTSHSRLFSVNGSIPGPEPRYDSDEITPGLHHITLEITKENEFICYYDNFEYGSTQSDTWYGAYLGIMTWWSETTFKSYTVTYVDDAIGYAAVDAEAAAARKAEEEAKAAAAAAEAASSGSTPSLLWDFGKTDCGYCYLSNVSIELKGDYATFTASGDDPFGYMDVVVDDVNNIQWAKIRVKNTSAVKAIELYSISDGRGYDGNDCTHFYLYPDTDNWYTYIVYLPNANIYAATNVKEMPTDSWYWRGSSAEMRLDPMWNSGHGGTTNESIDIDYVAFFSTKADAEAFRADQDSPHTLVEFEDAPTLPDLTVPAPEGGSSGSEPSPLWDFGETDCGYCYLSDVSIELKGDYATFTASGDDPFGYMDVVVDDVNNIQWAKIRVRNTSAVKAIELYSISDGRGYDGNDCTHMYLYPDTENWYTYLVYLPNANIYAATNVKESPLDSWYWRGECKEMRLDPMWNSGHGGTTNESIDLDYIAFFSNKADAEAFRADQDSAVTLVEFENGPDLPDLTVPAPEGGSSGSEPSPLWDFGETDCGYCYLSDVSIELKGDYATFTASGDDPFGYMDVVVDDVNNIQWAKIRVRNTSAVKAIELYSISDGRGYDGNDCTHLYLYPDTDNWYTYIVYLPNANIYAATNVKEMPTDSWYWRGECKEMRLDPMWNSGHGGTTNESINIDYVAFFSTKADAEAFRADQDSAVTLVEFENGPDLPDLTVPGLEGAGEAAPAEPEPPVETPAEPEAPAESPVDEELEAKAEAPNTFDFGIIAAVAAVVSLGGFALTKKKH